MNTSRGFLIAEASQTGQLRYWYHDSNNRLEIRDTPDYRWLLQDQVVQSVMARHSPTALCLPHQQALEPHLHQRTVRHALHLGLGGGDLLRWVHLHYPDVQQTAIDINPHMLELYQQFFQQTEQPDLHCTDAFAFLAQTSSQYDLIVVDLFSDDGSPALLFHDETYGNLQRCLLPHGLLVINLLPRTEQEWQCVADLLARHFPCWQQIPLPDYRNHLLLAEAIPATRTSPDHHSPD